ncbi:MAG TPA: NAD(P)H-binding protein [Bacteriovoracaceae bacterium]|nr:NAD(P)H-binding protein [Bacteriovoracaceae bacterium]
MNVLIIGATGLVGKEILKLALEASEVTLVKVFVRRSTNLIHPKLEEHIVDFNQIDSWKSKLNGDILFSAMGTTEKIAGSKEAQFRVDYEYQYHVARAARENGVSGLVLISSTGADAGSPFFYLKTKGQLEEALKKLNFKSLIIMRPSLLEGQREQQRSGEKFSHFFLSKLPKVKLLARMLPVEGRQVALKSLEVARQRATGTVTLEAADILF